MKQLNIHFIGIGGSGMSSLAQLMNSYKCKISGSDQLDSSKISRLKSEGIKINIGHKKENLVFKNYDYVVYSSAVSKDNPEILEAKNRELNCLSYPEAIGLLTKKFKTILICGTHGKTTTTAMIAATLLQNKLDPTVIIGAETKELGNNNFKKGDSEYLVLEACEYREAFLNYRADFIVINNIEPDHLDYFKNATNYFKAFEKLLLKNKKALIIANQEDKNVLNVLKRAKVKKVKFFKFNTELNSKLKLKIPGDHNLKNASAAFALSEVLSLNSIKSITALNNFVGAKRRQEILGKVGKTTFVDDYGHHPTEIKVTLAALKNKYGKKSKLICIFQPHQYSRTKALLKDFAKSFTDADVVIIPNILNVRDTQKDLKSISVAKLVSSINKKSKNAIDGLGLQNTLQLLRNSYKDYDIVLTLGAGNINSLAEQFLKGASK